PHWLNDTMRFGASAAKQLVAPTTRSANRLDFKRMHNCHFIPFDRKPGACRKGARRIDAARTWFSDRIGPNGTDRRARRAVAHGRAGGPATACGDHGAVFR